MAPLLRGEGSAPGGRHGPCFLCTGRAGPAPGAVRAGLAGGRSLPLDTLQPHWVEVHPPELSPLPRRWQGPGPGAGHSPPGVRLCKAGPTLPLPESLRGSQACSPSLPWAGVSGRRGPWGQQDARLSRPGISPHLAEPWLLGSPCSPACGLGPDAVLSSSLLLPQGTGPHPLCTKGAFAPGEQLENRQGSGIRRAAGSRLSDWILGPRAAICRLFPNCLDHRPLVWAPSPACPARWTQTPRRQAS